MTHSKYIGVKTEFSECIGVSDNQIGFRKARAVMVCECGNTFETLLRNLNRKTSLVSCGCRNRAGIKIPSIGEVFGKLTNNGFSKLSVTNESMHNFTCECGNKKDIKLNNVVSGRVKSCGCVQAEMVRLANGYTIDDTKFSNITDEAAYWLGFLLADGCVHNRTVTIGLKLSDISHLEKFRTFMCGNQKIYIRRDGSGASYAFNSVKVVKDLSSFGIVPNKSLVAKVHESLKLNHHFWRGVVDGDGSVRLKNKSLSLCGTSSVCEDFLYFCKSIVDTKATVRHTHENLWLVVVGVGGEKSSKLLKLLYDNPEIHLDRKYLNAMSIISSVKCGEIV